MLLDQYKGFTEACQGTKKYCFFKYYRKSLSENYENTFDCLKDRGVNLTSLITQDVDRHFWDIDSRSRFIERLRAANEIHTRYMWLERLQKTLDSPELRDRPENERVRVFAAEKDNLVEKASQAMNDAKKNLKQAYTPRFAQEGLDTIDAAKRDFEREWAELRTDQLALVEARPEVSTLLKKANSLFTRLRVIEVLDLRDLSSAVDALDSDAQQSLRHALNKADKGEKMAIAGAREAVNISLDSSTSAKISEAGSLIMEREEAW